MTDKAENGRWKSFTDQVEIAGHNLIEAVTGLAAEGNVRTLRIRTEAGPVFMEIPLTTGAIAGGSLRSPRRGSPLQGPSRASLPR